jgi:hypothetical protein
MIPSRLRLAMLALVCSIASDAALLRPDSASADNEFSGSYAIIHAINGSGLPAGFVPTDAHADYAGANHWTTIAGAVANDTARASLIFTSPTVLDGFYLWNHRAPGYGVTQFDLVFRNRQGDIIYSLPAQSAQQGVATAQTYSFPPISGVAQVDFAITANGGSTYAGVAEFAFRGEVLPPPAGIIRPTGATALSEFSASYDIGNVIDGSGLPAAFGPNTLHAAYAVDNHWTTEAGALGAGRAQATFSFKHPVALDAFHLWNHRSNLIAADSSYGVTTFDLVLRDPNGSALLSLLNQTAAQLVSYAQTYTFPTTGPVSSVDFIVVSNGGSPYTGLAEVAFNGTFAVFLNITQTSSAVELSWSSTLTGYTL